MFEPDADIHEPLPALLVGASLLANMAGGSCLPHLRASLLLPGIKFNGTLDSFVGCVLRTIVDPAGRRGRWCVGRTLRFTALPDKVNSMIRLSKQAIPSPAAEHKGDATLCSR